MLPIVFVTRLLFQREAVDETTISVKIEGVSRL